MRENLLLYLRVNDGELIVYEKVSVWWGIDWDEGIKKYPYRG